MKTVIDAVNEFKGEWPYPSHVGMICSKGKQVSYSLGEFSSFTEDSDSILNVDMWDLTCNIKEFEKCVDNLIGDPLAFIKWKESKNTEPELIDENTRQYKVSNIGNILHNLSCSMDDENEQNEFGGHASFLWDLADYFRGLEADITKTTKPVYTQAMADKDILPSVGMKCLIKLNESSLPEICKLLATFNDEAWVLLYDGHCTHSLKIRSGMFVAIDTRTDEEKALDDLMDAYWDNCNKKVSRHSPIVIKFIDAIKAGKIHNVTWSK